MIEVQVIASSSNGNCYRLTSGRHQLLLEAGLPIRQIKEAVGFNLGKLDGCLVSHEHNDHSRAVKALVDAGVDVYLSKGTAIALGNSSVGTTILTPDKPTRIGGHWIVRPLLAYHDAAEPLIFLISDRDDFLLFATDTFAIPYKFTTICQLMIECNYLPDKLEERFKDGSVSFKQASRLLHSHMSLSGVLDFIKINQDAMKYCRRIYLLHGSRDNGAPDIFKTAVQKATGKQVVVCGP